MREAKLGDKIIFGIVDRLPLKGFPPGKIKLKIRCEKWVMAYVKSSVGIRSFYVAEEDGFWVPSWENESNEQIENENIKK